MVMYNRNLTISFMHANPFQNLQERTFTNLQLQRTVWDKRKEKINTKVVENLISDHTLF